MSDIAPLLSTPKITWLLSTILSTILMTIYYFTSFKEKTKNETYPKFFISVMLFLLFYIIIFILSFNIIEAYKSFVRVRKLKKILGKVTDYVYRERLLAERAPWDPGMGPMPLPPETYPLRAVPWALSRYTADAF